MLRIEFGLTVAVTCGLRQPPTATPTPKQPKTQIVLDRVHLIEGTRCDRSLDGFFTGVALTALVLVIGRGTCIAMAAASGGSSSSGAAWKYASAIAASLSALTIRPCCL